MSVRRASLPPARSDIVWAVERGSPNRRLSVSPAKKSPSPRPQWQRDEDADACSRCGKRFTLLTRRHHCRHCGLVFCSACCNTKLPLPDLGYEDEVLVCNPCIKLKTNAVLQA